MIAAERLLEAAKADRELAYKLRGLESAVVRFAMAGSSLDVVVSGGLVTEVRPAAGHADVTVSAPDRFWRTAFATRIPPPGYESLTMGFAKGVAVEGDFTGLVAAYQGAWQRLYIVLREAVAGTPPRHAAPDPWRDTDTAIGRYAYVSANGVEARIYYETAGDGPIALLLQPTAGADGRQYRHLLANPEMQRRFTMYAYDLPYHGKSLPPIGERWWEQPYRPTRESLMNWVVAIAGRLGLDAPWFMGCSVGGQLALDLAAYHPDRFGAFISLNGWYDSPTPSARINNEIFRTPSVSEDYPMSIILGGTSPLAPEALAQEVYWIYRSNYPGVYAGDNDYFMHGHDLKECGHRIDAQAKPLYAIAGEYDSAARDDLHGGPAIAANLPGAVFRVARGLGHFAPSDDPQAFAEMIVPVLDEIIARQCGSGERER